MSEDGSISSGDRDHGLYGVTDVPGYFRALGRLIFSPGGFYEELRGRSRHYGHALVFLLCCSACFSALTCLVINQGPPLSLLIHFVNSVTMPLFTALLLYGVSLALCRGAFTLGLLCQITAYAHVTLLAAWIPGLAWAAGIWRFYLIGTGMTKAGHIPGWRAAILLSGTAAILLFLISLAKPLF